MRGSVFGYELLSSIPLTRLHDERARRGPLHIEEGSGLLDRDGELTGLTEPAAGWAGFAVARTAEGLVTWCSATGASLLEPRRRRLRVEPARGPTPAWEHRLLAMVLPLMLAERGDLLLHAAAIVVGEGAIVVCGPTGRGKSTLALSLAAAGHPVLAEDGVAVTVEGGIPTAWPGACGVRIKGGAGRAFAERLLPRSAEARSGEPSGPGAGAGGREIAVHPIPPTRQAAAPVRIDALVQLGERGGGLSVEPLARAAALPGLVGNLFHAGGTDALRPAYARAARLAELVPSFRASLPDDLDAAPDAARQLIELVAQTP